MRGGFWLGTEQESTAGHFTPGAIEGSYVVATKQYRTIISIHKKGGLQLAATIRTTREGPQIGAHTAAVPRGHKEETDGGQGGGRLGGEDRPLPKATSRKC